MRGILGLAVVLLLGFVVYRYANQTGGPPAGLGGTVDPGQVTGPAKDAASAFYHQPWFWTVAVAASLATIGMITWKKIGGWGRGFVVVCAAVAITVLVTR